MKPFCMKPFSKWLINGFRVFPNPFLPVTQPVLQMNPCGCSQEVLDTFNQYLLERFGTSPYFLVTENQDIFCHPDNFELLKKIGRK